MNTPSHTYHALATGEPGEGRLIIHRIKKFGVGVRVCDRAERIHTYIYIYTYSLVRRAYVWRSVLHRPIAKYRQYFEI